MEDKFYCINIDSYAGESWYSSFELKMSEITSSINHATSELYLSGKLLSYLPISESHLKLTWLAQFKCSLFNEIFYHNKRHLLIELDNVFFTILSENNQYNKETNTIELRGYFTSTVAHYYDL